MGKAKFLTTSGVSYHLEQIIGKAQERLLIISPYLKVNDRVRGLLVDASRRNVDVIVIYGKKKLKASESVWLDHAPAITRRYITNLHAKCYLSEHEALLTSMNLYEVSQVNNHEMGIVVPRVGESELYGDILRDAERLVRISEDVSPKNAGALSAAAERPPARRSAKTTAKTGEGAQSAARSGKSSTKPSVKAAGKTSSSAKSVAGVGRSPGERRATPAARAKLTRKLGYCIRCSKRIKQEPARPYCPSCYEIREGLLVGGFDFEYKEKRCHGCGAKNASTFIKPLCRACYKLMRRFP